MIPEWLDAYRQLVLVLITGSYVYVTGVFLFLAQKIERLRGNHLRHAEQAINEVREIVGLPPVKLED